MFFEAYGWTPEDFLRRTLRELVAYSKQIQMSNRERAKFQASLFNKKLELPSNQPNPETHPDAIRRIREIEERQAAKMGFSPKRE